MVANARQTASQLTDERIGGVAKGLDQPFRCAQPAQWGGVFPKNQQKEKKMALPLSIFRYWQHNKTLKPAIRQKTPDRISS